MLIYFTLINIFGISFLSKFSSVHFRYFLILNFNALTALYISIYSNYFYRENFSNYEEPLILVLSFTIFVPLFAFFLIKTINLKTQSVDTLRSQILRVTKKISSTFYIILIIYLAFYTSIAEKIINNSLIFRNLYQHLLENNYGFQLGVISNVGILVFCISLHRKNYAIAILTFITLLFLGKKHPLLFCLIIPAFYYVLTSRKVSLVKLIALFGLGITTLVIIAAFFANNYYGFLLQLSSSFDYFNNFVYFYNNYEFGSNSGEIYSTSYYRYLPRFIWEEKPYLYGAVLIHQALYPDEVALGFFPSVYEGYAVWLADFSYTGVALYGITYCVKLLFLCYKWNNDFVFPLISIGVLDPVLAITVATTLIIATVLDIRKLRIIKQ